VKSKQKTRNPIKNLGNPSNIKYAKSNPNNTKTDFLFGIPGFSKEREKSKHKNSKIQTIIRENPKKKFFFIV
jgi:hypothetical protein